MPLLYKYIYIYRYLNCKNTGMRLSESWTWLKKRLLGAALG